MDRHSLEDTEDLENNEFNQFEPSLHQSFGVFLLQEGGQIGEVVQSMHLAFEWSSHGASHGLAV